MTLPAILVLIIVFLSLLTLGGMAIMMIAGAIMGKGELVTSWPPSEEAQFLTYEQHNKASNGKAWTIALLVSIVMTIFVIGVYAGVKPDMHDVTKDMNMSNLSSKKKDEAPAPKTEKP